jgi:hypothetical protein
MALNNLGDLAFDQGDFAAAKTLHEESLAIKQELGDRQGIAESLEGLAEVASAAAEPARAARIWGSAERLRAEIGSALPPSERPRYNRQLDAARAAIGDNVAFDLAWQEGRAMKLDDALRYALEKG